MLRTRAIPAAAVLLGVALVVAGCTSAPDGGPTASTTSAPSPVTATVTTTATASPVASASPSASTRVDPDAPKGQCADSQLRISEQADPEGGAAGHVGSWVVFENIGTVSCVLAGAPGVSVVGDGNGTQLGRAASHPTGAATSAVTIAPKRYALAELISSSVDAKGGIYGDGKGGDPRCEAKQADGYRIYAPHSFRAVFAKRSIYACTTDVDWMSIGSVTGPVKGFSPKL